jgi:hypothetical protein
MSLSLGRFRHVARMVAAAAVLAVLVPKRADPENDRRTALAHALAKRGVYAEPEDIGWLERPTSPLGGAARAIVRGAPTKGDPADIFVVETRLSPEGVLLSVGAAYNLTETSSADEGRPLIRGQRIAYVTRPLVAEMTPTVHVIDLAGQPEQGTAGWTRLERAQNALSNAQATGQARGVMKRTFAIEPDEKKGEPRAADAAREVEIDLDATTLTIRSGARAAQLPLDAPVAAPAWIRTEAASEIPRPGNLVTWAVDRVRNEVGDDAMQTVKAVAFTALDFVMRHKENVTGDTGAADIAKDMGTTEGAPPVRAMPVDPEIGWPPAPLDPFVKPALGGEGQWNPLDKDNYVRKNEGLPPAFLTTFIRTDPTRKVTRVYIALWDPRQVELHMMAGNIEPKSATGEAGPGLIPRTPEVLKRVVAASNAGFQALHGEFGMMADGVVYLPPKPYAATVAVTRDGSTGFGTWPENTAIPENILSYRQNMTVMVQDEKFNPYNRTWWGGTPPGWADKTHTVRTGICLTKERFVAYFYGADLSPDALAQAMISARCSFGLALDMNAGHSGLEFYKIGPFEELDKLKPDTIQNDWQHEGEVPGINGWRFRARRLIRGMGLMNFPRYIKREPRDFFYMTLRHVLPGPALAPVVTKPALAGEGEWRLKGLPQHGFPYAMALSEIRPDPARPDLRVRALQLDPRMLSAAPADGGKGHKTVVMVDAGDKPAADAPSLWHSAGAFSIGPQPPVPEAVRLASGVAAGAPAVAAVGVYDEGGMLLYLEMENPPQQPTAGDGKLLSDYLKKLGCSFRLLLSHPMPVTLGGDSDWAGNPVRPPTGPGAVRLVRAEGASAKRVFEDTPVVPFDTWYPLQQKRIRYFKKPQVADE